MLIRFFVENVKLTIWPLSFLLTKAVEQILFLQKHFVKFESGLEYRETDYPNRPKVLNAESIYKYILQLNQSGLRNYKDIK